MIANPDTSYFPRPGQYLTDALDVLKRGNSTNPRLRAHAIYLQSLAARGVKFIAPAATYEPMTEGLRGHEVRPPFPVTIYECDIPQQTELDFAGKNALIIVAQDMDTFVDLHFVLGAYRLHEAVVWTAVPFHMQLSYDPDEDDVNYRGTPMASIFGIRDLKPSEKMLQDSEGKQAAWLSAFGGTYLKLCHILAQYETTTTDAVPDAAENRRRRMRGKAPLYTYKTLIIGPRKQAVEVRKGTGTHASPRSHLRRGFYRTSKTGVRHWVSATMVKGETPGFVHKDYEIKQGAQ